MSSANLAVFEVLLPLNIDMTFSYYAPNDGTKLGDLVKIKFRNQNHIGVIWSGTKKGFKANYKIKNIEHKIEGKSLKPEMIAFIKSVARYNIIPIGMVLKMVIFNLDTHKIITRRKEVPLRDDISIKLSLSQMQKKSYLDISNSNKVSLLEGVTGSGKTEVYLHLAHDIMKLNKQVLILLPEIALASQLTKRFEERFPDLDILKWHSGITQSKKREIWALVNNQRAKMIIGARSALFLPFSNLGLIVIDEEHDSSFKQEDGSCYNARDMATIRAKLDGCKLVLSTATPSIETVQNVNMGKYHHTKLTQRFKNAQMPVIDIVDLAKCDTYPISQELKKAVEDAIKSQKQSILFINRRGYSPICMCDACGQKIECPNCTFWLVYHKKTDCLRCHYCGFKSAPRLKCKEEKCENYDKESQIKPIGFGVEKIEEVVKKNFPDARVVIASSDTMSDEKSTSEIISKIMSKEVDIIIGTKIIAKGFHFPDIDLVGVLDVDSGMITGDLRAFERLYQTIYQIAGRAGRQSAHSRVILQTYNPSSQILKYIREYDIDSFLRSEIEDREVAFMPPFSRLSMLKIESLDEESQIEYIKQLMGQCPIDKRIKIIGPSIAPIPIIRRRHRKRILVNSDKNIDIQNIISEWVSRIKIPNGTKVKIDVDPYNFS